MALEILKYPLFCDSLLPLLAQYDWPAKNANFFYEILDEHASGYPGIKELERSDLWTSTSKLVRERSNLSDPRIMFFLERV